MTGKHIFEKLCAGTITTAMMISAVTCVGAQTEADVLYNSEAESISVSVNTDKKVKTAVLTVEKDGVFYAIAEFGRNEDGVFAYTCALPEYCASGRYVAKITVGGETDEAEFDHVNKLGAAVAMETVNRATKETFAQTIKDVGEMLAVDYEEFEKYSKNLTDVYFVYKPDSDMTSAEFATLYGKALALAKIAECTDNESAEEMIYANAGKLGFDRTAFSALEESEKSEVIGRFLAMDYGIKPLTTQFEHWIALADINNNRDNSVAAYKEALLETYDELLGLDTSDYEKSADKSEVIREVMSSSYDSVAELREAFYDAVDKVGPKSSGSGGGGGGSSSGGGKKGSSVSMVNWGSEVMDTTPQKTPETVENVPFADVPADHWCSVPVASLYEKKIINGVDAKHFAPENKVTRAEFAKMVVLALFPDADVSSVAFEDVNSSQWYFDSVSKAAGLGLINGTGNGSFEPDSTVSRQDAAVIIYRALEKKGKVLSSTSAFTDNDQIASYARDAASALKGAGILSGMNDGSFAPNGELTRAQAAKMLYETLGIIS